MGLVIDRKKKYSQDLPPFDVPLTEIVPSSNVRIQASFCSTAPPAKIPQTFLILCLDLWGIATKLTSVPNLSLDSLAIYIDGPCSELNTNSRLGFEIELISCESG